MSTVPIIVAHEVPAGRLKRFRPKFRGREQERRLLTVERGIYEWLHDTPLLEADQEMRAQARVNCGVFVLGHEIDDLNFMKRVEDRRKLPPSLNAGVWALSVRLDPQHRLFGMFAVQNWFVVLSRADRAALENSPQMWHAQIDLCVTLWTDLFPGRTPIISDNLGDYLSFNVEKCDERW